jgi:prenyltransferase beta subunit
MLEPEPKKPLVVRIQEKLAASRFLTFSVLLHAVLVLMGGSVVLFKSYVEPPDFAASDGGLVSADVATQAPPEQPPEIPQEQFKQETPQLTAPTISAISTTNVNTPTFQVAAVAPVIKPVPTDALQKAAANVSKAIGTKGMASNIPATMGSRMGGTARSSAMQMNGGKKESEEAVMRALRWLVKVQNPDGSWGKGGKQVIAAMTGFSVLSFLGHGETPVSAEFGATVQKALDWIVDNGKKTGGRLSMEPAFSQQGVYAHAIATYALGEYYTMTKDERVIETLKEAITFIVKGQSSDGSWRYAYSDANHPDTSVSGWQIQALKAAHLTGLNVEGVDPALDKAMIYLKSVQGPKGGFGYSAKQDGYSLAGVGVLCTYFWKQDKDKSVRDGIEFIIDQSKTNFPVEYKGDKADLYAWYYHTQACLMVGGAAWNTWNRMFQDQIVKNQSPDGSWPPIAGKSAGGEMLRDPEGVGPIYRTNLCTLMLEVYYRYMPTTKGG